MAILFAGNDKGFRVRWLYTDIGLTYTHNEQACISMTKNGRNLKKERHAKEKVLTYGKCKLLNSQKLVEKHK